MHRTKILIIATLLTAGLAIQAAPVKTEIVKTEAGWQLLRDGKPFFIKGVGGSESRELIVQYGGNSFRTWGVGPETERELDQAQKLGLTVTVGIWLGHKRHGFDYHNAKAVQEQFDRARAAVLKYRNHPALLMWGIGNEMENYEPAGDPAVYKAIEDIAAMIKKEDPNHPTMTVFAEIGSDKVKLVHEHCPAVDVIGINSYGGGPSVAERYRKAGGTKPYVITEFGPAGTWEIKLLPLGAAPELTSTAKAAWYRNTYINSISGPKANGLALGSFAFTWGFKREASATWYGMFLPDGTKLAAVDAMSEMWTGQPVTNPCPVIRRLTLAAGDGIVTTGVTVRVLLEAAPATGGPLKVTWELHRDWFKYETGGDNMPETPQYPEAIVKSSDQECVLQMPADGGGYRLYATVHDKNGGAVANVPLLVPGLAPKPRAHQATLPLVVFGPGQQGAPYIASGWMGDHQAISAAADCTTHLRAGSSACLKFGFTKGSGWGGIMWQNPANDWGNKPGGLNLTGATKLTFWARGEDGGEKVAFSFGGLKPPAEFPDSAAGKLEVLLTTTWQQYSLDLAGKDLSCIKTGFAWTTGHAGKPIIFYVDDVRYE